MILADTSVWIDHLRSGDARLTALLETGQILAHPFVIGELALGNLRQRNLVLARLRDLPEAILATADDVQDFIERFSLMGLGIGFVDTHLLASTCLTPDTALWTRDKKLREIAARLGLAGDS